MFIRDSRIETGGNGLTSGSTLKYQLTKRDTTTKIPARNDGFRVGSSGIMMVRRGEERGRASATFSFMDLDQGH